MSLFVVQFGLQTNHLSGFVGALVGLTALLLPFLFMVVQTVAVALAVQLNVLVLRLQTRKNKEAITFS